MVFGFLGGFLWAKRSRLYSGGARNLLESIDSLVYAHAS